MSCGNSEERLALWMDSNEVDLSVAEIRERDRHLPSCAFCREGIAKLRESQLFVKTLRADSVSSAVVIQVHAQVMDRVSELKRPPAWVIQVERSLLFGMRWKYALAGFGSLVLVGSVALGIFWKVQWHEQTKTQTPPVSASLVAEVPDSIVVNPPAGNTAKVAPVRRVKHTPKKEPAPVDALIPGEPPQKIMVKLFTDDPSVVIYWSLD
jgi:anti-sigma factor RsiW